MVCVVAFLQPGEGGLSQLTPAQGSPAQTPAAQPPEQSSVWLAYLQTPPTHVPLGS